MRYPVRLSPEELAERWGMKSVRTLANWRSQKIGPAWIPVGKKIMYELEDVMEYEQAKKIDPSKKIIS